jgi:hypothetical protein
MSSRAIRGVKGAAVRTANCVTNDGENVRACTATLGTTMLGTPMLRTPIRDGAMLTLKTELGTTVQAVHGSTQRPPMLAKPTAGRPSNPSGHQLT